MTDYTKADEKAARDAFNKRRARARAKRVAENSHCGLCAHFFQVECVPAEFVAKVAGTDECFGVCRRYPPTPVNEKFDSRFPSVVSSQCCGEFRRKP